VKVISFLAQYTHAQVASCKGGQYKIEPRIYIVFVFIVQNKIRMVYPVSWTAVCYVTVITLFIKNVGVVRPNFGGSGPPSHPPVVAPLLRQ